MTLREELIGAGARIICADNSDDEQEYCGAHRPLALGVLDAFLEVLEAKNLWMRGVNLHRFLTEALESEL